LLFFFVHLHMHAHTRFMGTMHIISIIIFILYKLWNILCLLPLNLPIKENFVQKNITSVWLYEI